MNPSAPKINQPKPSADPANRIYVWMLFIFTLSGFSALAYQVAWQRMMGLFSGSDSIASALAVGAFLAGLGIGNLISSCFSDRLKPRTALLVFALCEIGVALFGLASKFLLYDVLFKRFLGLSHAYTGIFLVLFACLLVPTVLMGLSLPILARTVVVHLAQASRRIGWMYGVNTLGAAIGAFVAGWFLMGAYGCEGTITWAVAANLAVCLLSLLLAATAFRRSAVDSEPASITEPEAEAIPLQIGPLAGWCLLFGLSGFMTISLEIIWFRYVGVLLHGSPYGFALVLAVLLLGEAIGSLWGGKLSTRMKDPLAFFIIAQGVIMVMVLASILWLYQLYGQPEVFHYISSHTVMFRGITGNHLYVIFGLILLIVFPAALVLGFSFPVVQKAVQDDSHRIGRRVGVVLLVNVLGNTAGSLVTGLLLLRVFGTAGSLLMLTVLAVVLVGFLVIRRWPGWRAWQAGACVALIAILLTLASVFPDKTRFWIRFYIGPTSHAALVASDHTGVAMLSDIDGPSQSLYVGRIQGFIPFSPTHVDKSIIALCHPAPKDILLIGLGAGGQAYTMGANPATRSVTVVELVRPVYEVMRTFAADNGGHNGLAKLFSDPRYTFHVADGRRFLFLSDQKYDVIQTDATIPVEAHGLLLYSREYFEQVRASLKTGGIALALNATLRIRDTFLKVFPYVVRVGEILIGSNQPIPYDHQAFIKVLEKPSVHAYFTSGGVDFNNVINRIRGAKVAHYGPEYDRSKLVDINTDLFPKDEYFLSRYYRNQPRSPDPEEVGALPTLLARLQAHGVQKLYCSHGWLANAVAEATAGSVWTPREEVRQPVVIGVGTAFVVSQADALALQEAFMVCGVTLDRESVGPWALFRVAAGLADASRFLAESDMVWWQDTVVEGLEAAKVSEWVKKSPNEFTALAWNSPFIEAWLKHKLALLPDHPAFISALARLYRGRGDVASATSYEHRFHELVTPACPVDVRYRGGLALTGVTGHGLRGAPGDVVRIRLFWQLPPDVDPRPTVFLHARKGEQTLFQFDEAIMPGQSPRQLAVWEGQPISQEISLRIPDNLPAGPCTLHFGVVEPEGTERWKPKTNLPVQRRAIQLPLVIEVGISSSSRR